MMCDIMQFLMIAEKIKDLDPELQERINPFFREIISLWGNKMHSLYLVGSAITGDFMKGKSDINSLLIVNAIDFNDLQSLWELGRRHKKRGIAAPLCLTPAYIRDSLDVFPIEFLDFKLIHINITGDDLLAELNIKREHLRLQCEREIKSRLINLRQGFLSSLGEDKYLRAILIDSVNGTAPLFRAILTLLDKPSPLNKADLFSALENQFGIDNNTFKRTLLLKQGNLKLKDKECVDLFMDFYNHIEKLGNMLNSI